MFNHHSTYSYSRIGSIERALNDNRNVTRFAKISSRNEHAKTSSKTATSNFKINFLFPQIRKTKIEKRDKMGVRGGDGNTGSGKTKMAAGRSNDAMNDNFI